MTLCLMVTHAVMLCQSSKCTEQELEAFGEEYEQCHSKALTELQVETSKHKSR